MIPSPRRSARGTATRARILDAVRAAPGVTIAELARRAGMDHSTATYHVHRLARLGLVITARHGGRVHCFLPDAAARARALAIAGRRPRAADVMARLGPEPRALGAVAAGLTLSPAGVYWHLQRLAALGLAVIEGPPRARRYRAAPQPGPPAADLVALPAAG
jgi:predicted transcriptional regulator